MIFVVLCGLYASLPAGAFATWKDTRSYMSVEMILHVYLMNVMK